MPLFVRRLSTSLNIQPLLCRPGHTLFFWQSKAFFLKFVRDLEAHSLISCPRTVRSSPGSAAEKPLVSISLVVPTCPLRMLNMQKLIWPKDKYTLSTTSCFMTNRRNTNRHDILYSLYNIQLYYCFQIYDTLY